MSKNTVNVKGISQETSEKEVRDFFSFWYAFHFHKLDALLVHTLTLF